MTSNSELRPLLKYMTFMKMAEKAAGMSYDPKYQVGALIVSSDMQQIASIGVNGNYAGGSNHRHGGINGPSFFICAEENALLKADISRSEPHTMFVTMKPCRMCAKRIITKGINEVVYLRDYEDAFSDEVFAGSDVLVQSMAEKMASLFCKSSLQQELVDWDDEEPLGILLRKQLCNFFDVNQKPLKAIKPIKLGLTKGNYITTFCQTLYDLL